MKSRVLAVAALVSLVSGTNFSSAQNAPEVVVRQGDTIQWIASAGPPHKLKFGASGTTPIAEIETILEFKPPLVKGESSATTGPLQSATVKVDKATIGKTFVFTCGIHPAQMMSLPFVVAAKVEAEPARTHQIMGETGLHWHVHADTTR